MEGIKQIVLNRVKINSEMKTEIYHQSMLAICVFDVSPYCV